MYSLRYFCNFTHNLIWSWGNKTIFFTSHFLSRSMLYKKKYFFSFMYMYVLCFIHLFLYNFMLSAIAGIIFKFWNDSKRQKRIASCKQGDSFFTSIITICHNIVYSWSAGIYIWWIWIIYMNIACICIGNLKIFKKCLYLLDIIF